jgi:hypothetical protein
MWDGWDEGVELGIGMVGMRLGWVLCFWGPWGHCMLFELANEKFVLS